jgi:hypothetical protein
MIDQKKIEKNGRKNGMKRKFLILTQIKIKKNILEQLHTLMQIQFYTLAMVEPLLLQIYF